MYAPITQFDPYIIQKETQNEFFSKKEKKGVVLPFPTISNLTPILQESPEEEIQSIEEHYAYPIKDKQDILRISNFLLEARRYRDNAIFIVGINVGLRCSDLRLLKVKDFLNSDGTFKEVFYILEGKTANTRKTKQNRHIAINEAVKQAITFLLAHTNKSLEDYLFTPESNNTKCGTEPLPPLSRKSFHVIIKQVTAELGIEGRYATHTLRKTFGYHLMKDSENDPRMLSLLQQIFNHSSQQITLRYIGFTEEEVSNAYNNLNLGFRGVR